MDLPATQAMDDEDLVPTQQFSRDREHERLLIGTLLIRDSNEQHSIYSGSTTIGRSPTNTIFLNDETVSKRHAEIEAASADKAIFIKDLGSINTTKINDTKLRPEFSYQIKDNDRLTFGKITAIFRIHHIVNDSLVSGTPQVNRNARAVIPDTPESSMSNSSVLEGDVSTIPGTQADENDSCFRRPQIPVRTSISNEHQSPKLLPFILDDVPSPLSNSREIENDISEVETQKFNVDNTKEMTGNSSTFTVETQKIVQPTNSNVNSHDNQSDRTFNNLSVKKVLSDEFEKELLEDAETQAFVCSKSDSSCRRSENASIYCAETQKVQPEAQDNQCMENLETQPFVPAKSVADKTNVADVSIHSALTQKIGGTMSDKTNVADVSIHSALTQKIGGTVSENEPIENLDTQPFTRNSLSSAKRRSANVSIYSAETQKAVSNESFDDIETQAFISGSGCSKLKSADVSIYSAATQKIESTTENDAIEDLETQKFHQPRASISSSSRQIDNQEQMASSLSFSIQDVDTMPFTKYNVPSGENISDAGTQNISDHLVDSAAILTKPDNENKVHDNENENGDDEKPSSEIMKSVPTSSKELDKSQANDNIDTIFAQDHKQVDNETPSKSMSKNLLESSGRFDKSNSPIQSDDEEEIFSQNLIENSPFNLLLDDSKNDSKEQSAVDLQADIELGNEKTVTSECNMPLNKASNSLDSGNSVKNKSIIVENDDAETDEEGVFSNHLSEENENEKPRKENDNDSETDEEGVFSNHLSEENGEKSNSKPEDSETDEEGVFVDQFSKNSKGIGSINNSNIIQESESEEETVSSNKSLKNQTNESVDNPGENVATTATDSFSANKSVEKVHQSSEAKRSLEKVKEIVLPESPVPESDDDIFNENYEEKRTSSSNTGEPKFAIDNTDNRDSIHNSSSTKVVSSELAQNSDDNNDVDELAPTQIVETDMSLVPTQIVSTRRMSNSEGRDSEEIDELAPTQLMETQTLPECTHSTPTRKVSGAFQKVAKEYDDMDLAPTQKLVETQECTEYLAPTQKLVETQEGTESLAPTQKLVETQDCAESLAPTQLVVDTQVCSEEMGTLQFSESLAPTQIIENEPNDVEDEIATSPKVSSNTSKRQLEEVEITSNKKMKTEEVSQKVDLNSTVEQNLNEMFEGPEEKITDGEAPIETQQLENILESSQLEENSVTELDVSSNKPSPTLSNRKNNIRGKNRRLLMLNKSGYHNTTNKSVVNLNDTIEKNLNDLFDNNVGHVETPEPEPMLTQQLESVLDSSQDKDALGSKDEEGRTLGVTRKKSRLSLSMNLNNSMLQNQKEKEKDSSSAETTKAIKTASQGSLNKKSPQEDYSANLEDKNDNTISEQISSKNDKNIVYRRGTIGFTDDLKPVSTYDRIAFLDKYSTSDSQSDGDDYSKLKSPSTSSSKKCVSLRLERVDFNSSLSSSTSDLDIEKNKVKSPVLLSKKIAANHHHLPSKRNPVVRLSKLASPLYRRYVKPEKRGMACGLVGFTPDLQPVESEELVSAASTESEDDLKMQVAEPRSEMQKEVYVNDDDQQQLPADSPMEDEENNSDDDLFDALPEVKIAGTAKCPATSSQIAVNSDPETDSESIDSVKLEIPERWKLYAQKRFDIIYKKCDDDKQKTDDYESDKEEDESMETKNDAVDFVTDDQEERNAAINRILAQIGADKSVKSDSPRRRNLNCSGKENGVTTRSRKLRSRGTPSPKPIEAADTDSDKTDYVVSSSSDSENSELEILPKYRPVSPLRIDIEILTKKRDNKVKPEFVAPRIDNKRKINRAKPRTSPQNMRRRRKSACNNDIKNVTQYESDADVKIAATSNIGTVDKDGLVFQVSRNDKAPMTTTQATSRMSDSTISRTKRIIDSDDDDESTCEPTSKRLKTLANRHNLQQPTVVISPMKDKLKKLSEANRLNIANVSSNFKQTTSAPEKKKAAEATKKLTSRVALAKTTRTDSSETSAVESSIVEDKNGSRNKLTTRGRQAARNKQAKVGTSSERSANSSKENLKESEDQKPKTRGRGRRNQTTDLSVSNETSSQDEISASSVESKSTRSTRGRLVRHDQTKKEEAKATKQQSKVVQDSDSEMAEEPKTATRKNTRNRQTKTVRKSDSVEKNVSNSEKNNESELQSSSQSESVNARATRTRKNKVNRDSDSCSLEAPEAASTRRNAKRSVKDKHDFVVKVTKVDSNKETITKSYEDEDDRSKDEVNVYKLMKKKMNPKPEESKKPPARKTRTRANKNATLAVESSSEESQEVSDFMKNSNLEEPKLTTKRRGRAVKSNVSYVEGTESSDDVFEKPTRPKRARLAKADKNESSQVSEIEEDSKQSQSSQKSTRKKHSPSPSPTPPSEAVLTPSRTSRLSLSPTKRPEVLFTGEKSENHRNILTKLGGIETDEFDRCSVLITDKVRRTFKFLCSLARGIPIASVKWLDESKKANRFLDLEDYILNDSEAEAKFQFNLRNSLDKARKSKMLAGYTILLSSKIKQPPIAELKEMVISSGGKPLVRAPAKWPQKCVVVTTKEELDSVKKLMAKAPKSVTVQSVEFILTGILRQDASLNEFKLLG